MNKIISKNFLSKRSRLFAKQGLLSRRYSNDKDKNIPEQEQLIREKGSKPKAENLQEESYFHREEAEQLKELKKKLKQKKPEADKNK